MKNFKRIISIFITLKPMASVFHLLALLIVGLSAQEQHKGSARALREYVSHLLDNPSPPTSSPPLQTVT